MFCFKCKLMFEKKKKKAKSLQGPHGHKLKLSLVLVSHRIKAPKELKMNLGVELVLAVDGILPFQAALHCIVATLEQLQSFLYFFFILSLF